MATANFLSKIPIWYWILVGLFFFWLFRSMSPSIRRKIPYWSETEKARRFTLSFLGLGTVMGGLALSVYAIYITLLQGGGKMTPDEYNNLASQIVCWVYLYEALLFAIVGISFGGIIWFMAQVIRGFVKRKKKPNTQETEQETINIVSTKELKSTLEKIEGYKKAKSDLDDFFNGIKGDKPKEK